MEEFHGKTFVIRIDETVVEGNSTVVSDLMFLAERGVKPIVVAPAPHAARTFVAVMNRAGDAAVSVSGPDAGMLPAATPERLGAVRARLLHTLLDAGYVPVVAPTALGAFGGEVAVAANDVASAIGKATEAARVLFFDRRGGVTDLATAALIDELTPAEALALADSGRLPSDLSAAIRAAAVGVRGGVAKAQIVDGRIAHASIVELLTARHLGTQVTGSVFLEAS